MDFKKLLFIFLLLPLFTFSQGKFSGYMFGDYYYFVMDHKKELEDQNGFWFRRIYFTYDYKISEKFFTRFRLELNSPGDFKTKDNLKPYLKDAYLGINIGKGKGYFGISPTPTWEFLENFWEYRSVEKTPADLYKHDSSRDFGIAFKGPISSHLSYHFMIANGEGTASEVNKDKKARFSILFKKEAVHLEIYTDYGEGENHTNSYMYQGIFGIKNEKLTLGFQYYRYTKQQGEGHPSLENDVFSAFFNYNFSQKITLLFRVDKSQDPNPSIENQSYIPFDKDHPFFFYLFGLDFKVLKDISIIPNFEYVNYEKYNGTKPDSDLIFKITFYYTFN
jgi:hypothetical protein